MALQIKNNLKIFDKINPIVVRLFWEKLSAKELKSELNKNLFSGKTPTPFKKPDFCGRRKVHFFS